MGTGISMEMPDISQYNMQYPDLTTVTASEAVKERQLLLVAHHPSSYKGTAPDAPVRANQIIPPVPPNIVDHIAAYVAVENLTVADVLDQSDVAIYLPTIDQFVVEGPLYLTTGKTPARFSFRVMNNSLMTWRIKKNGAWHIVDWLRVGAIDDGQPMVNNAMKYPWYVMLSEYAESANPRETPAVDLEKTKWIDMWQGPVYLDSGFAQPIIINESGNLGYNNSMQGIPVQFYLYTDRCVAAIRDAYRLTNDIDAVVRRITGDPFDDQYTEQMAAALGIAGYRTPQLIEHCRKRPFDVECQSTSAVDNWMDRYCVENPDAEECGMHPAGVGYAARKLFVSDAAEGLMDKLIKAVKCWATIGEGYVHPDVLAWDGACNDQDFCVLNITEQSMIRGLDCRKPQTQSPSDTEDPQDPQTQSPSDTEDPHNSQDAQPMDDAEFPTILLVFIVCVGLISCGALVWYLWPNPASNNNEISNHAVAVSKD